MNGTNILEVTKEGLEAGFTVSHIAAFDLETCSPDTKAGKVLAVKELKDFDQIPVKSDGRIIGVLERREELEGSVGKNMRALDDSILVSADQPLPKFLPTLERCPYRLVVLGPEITGIVTPSDIGKLPVRLMAFTLVAHLELLMAGVIRQNCPTDSELLDKLHPRQRVTIEGNLKKRKKENLVISALELTNLSHKITVVGEILNSADFKKQLKPVKDLRNSVAHAADFVGDCGSVQGFLERLKLAEHWIGELNPMLGPRTVS